MDDDVVPADEAARAIFERLDLTGSGFISSAEVERCLPIFQRQIGSISQETQEFLDQLLAIDHVSLYQLTTLIEMVYSNTRLSEWERLKLNEKEEEREGDEVSELGLNENNEGVSTAGKSEKRRLSRSTRLKSGISSVKRKHLRNLFDSLAHQDGSSSAAQINREGISRLHSDDSFSPTNRFSRATTLQKRRVSDTMMRKMSADSNSGVGFEEFVENYSDLITDDGEVVTVPTVVQLEIEVLRKDSGILTSLYKEALRQNEEIHQALQKTRQDSAALLAEAQADADAIATENESTRESLRICNQKLREKTAEIENQKAIIQRLEEECATSIEVSGKVVESSAARYEELESMLQHLQKANDKLQSDLEDAEGQTRKAEAAVDSIEQQKSSLEITLESVRSDLDRIEAEKGDLFNELEDVRGARDHYRDLAEEYQVQAFLPDDATLASKLRMQSKIQQINRKIQRVKADAGICQHLTFDPPKTQSLDDLEGDSSGDLELMLSNTMEELINVCAVMKEELENEKQEHKRTKQHFDIQRVELAMRTAEIATASDRDAQEKAVQDLATVPSKQETEETLEDSESEDELPDLPDTECSALEIDMLTGTYQSSEASDKIKPGRKEETFAEQSAVIAEVEELRVISSKYLQAKNEALNEVEIQKQKILGKDSDIQRLESALATALLNSSLLDLEKETHQKTRTSLNAVREEVKQFLQENERLRFRVKELNMRISELERERQSHGKSVASRGVQCEAPDGSSQGDKAAKTIPENELENEELLQRTTEDEKTQSSNSDQSTVDDSALLTRATSLIQAEPYPSYTGIQKDLVATFGHDAFLRCRKKVRELIQKQQVHAENQKLHTDSKAKLRRAAASMRSKHVASVIRAASASSTTGSVIRTDTRMNVHNSTMNGTSRRVSLALKDTPQIPTRTASLRESEEHRGSEQNKIDASNPRVRFKPQFNDSVAEPAGGAALQESEGGRSSERNSLYASNPRVRSNPQVREFPIEPEYASGAVLYRGATPVKSVHKSIVKFHNLGRQKSVKWFRDAERTRGVGKTDNQIWPWFHGVISRQESEELLKDMPPQSFLVRVSASRYGYALSVRVANNKSPFRHYMIEQNSIGQYGILDFQKDPNNRFIRDPLCNTLEILVRYYSTYRMNEDCDKLGNPCAHDIGKLKELFDPLDGG